VALAELQNAQKQLEIGMKGARKEDREAQEALIRSLEARRQAAEDALSDTRLLAPFDGEVAAKSINNFEEVQALTPVISYQDVSKIEIDIDISERDMVAGSEQGSSIEEVAKNVDAVATFTALAGREFPVTVKSYETQADPLTQTFRITVIMDQPENDPIRPGMNALVRSKRIRGGAEGFLIPAAAVFAAPDGSKRVWTVAGGRATARPIAGDEILEGRMRVTEGLREGDTIAVSAVNSLSEGDEVIEMTDLKNL